MKYGSTILLKAVLLLMAVAVLALGIFAFPTVMNRDIVGGYQPILFGMYVTTIPFCFALYQAMKLLNLIDKNQAFSDASIVAFKYIKYCAFAISTGYALGMPYTFMVAQRDDAPGVVLIALIFIFAAFVVGTFAALLQALIQNAVDIKLENDLTV